MRPRAFHPRKTATGWRINAPAKLNLYLDILGRRDDGFHDLETLITPISLCDTLELAPKPAGDSSITLEVQRSADPRLDRFEDLPPGERSVPTDQRNLVVRALSELRSALGERRGVAARLWKRIPSRAGLGGGSSDAAAALVAGQAFWGKRLAKDQVAAIAARLGSDVPVFLQGGPAICRGRGEVVQPVKLPAGMPCVMAQPPVGLGAGEVFQGLDQAEIGVAQPSRVEALLSALRSGRLAEAHPRMLNRLQQPAQRISKWMATLGKAFSRLPAPAWQMTGSGSTWFGLCHDWRSAHHAAARLRATHPGWVGLASTL